MSAPESGFMGADALREWIKEYFSGRAMAPWGRGPDPLPACFPLSGGGEDGKNRSVA
jgi:hypothetical protein